MGPDRMNVEGGCNPRASAAAPIRKSSAWCEFLRPLRRGFVLNPLGFLRLVHLTRVPESSGKAELRQDVSLKSYP